MKHTAHITFQGERYYLGTFGSAEAASAAQLAERSAIAAGTSDICRCAGTMSMASLAAELKIPVGTLKRWSAEGLPSLQVGKLLRFVRRDAEAWIASRYPNTVARSRRSMIYVVQRDSDDAVKIGWSSDVERRTRELRKGETFQLVLLFVFPGDKPDELRLHTRFAADRLEGEWFRFGDAIREWLDRARGIAA